MRRKWSPIAVGVLVLCVVGIMPLTAQGPGGNPIYASIEYVDQMVADLYEYIDQQIEAVLVHLGQEVARLDARIDEVGGGGGTGPDFDLPADEDWIIQAYTYSNPYGCTDPVLHIASNDPTAFTGKSCTWQGTDIGNVPARVIATNQGQIVGYGTGSCSAISFRNDVVLPAVGETVDFDMWFLWMGTEKTMTVSRTVTEPPNSQPVLSMCSGDQNYGSGIFLVDMYWQTGDDDPCEILNYSVDFGDGTTYEGESLPETHVYDAPAIYPIVASVVDQGGLSDVCLDTIGVE